MTKPTLRSIIQEFLRWQRAACGPHGDEYLNGDVDMRGREHGLGGTYRIDERDAWDDLADICKRARKALREKGE